MTRRALKVRTLHKLFLTWFGGTFFVFLIVSIVFKQLHFLVATHLFASSPLLMRSTVL